MTIQAIEPNLFAPYRVNYMRNWEQLTIFFHCAEIAQDFAREHNGTIICRYTREELPLYSTLWCEPCGFSHV